MKSNFRRDRSDPDIPKGMRVWVSDDAIRIVIATPRLVTVVFAVINPFLIGLTAWAYQRGANWQFAVAIWCFACLLLIFALHRRIIVLDRDHLEIRNGPITVLPRHRRYPVPQRLEVDRYDLRHRYGQMVTHTDASAVISGKHSVTLLDGSEEAVKWLVWRLNRFLREGT